MPGGTIKSDGGEILIRSKGQAYRRAQFEDIARQASERQLFRRQAQGNSLFRNDGSAGFHDVSEEAGVRTGRWAWASEFVDLDGDGLLDLFVQNGFITGERVDDL